MDSWTTQNDDHVQENAISQGDGSNGGGTTGNIISRMELEVSFGSEKLLNLQILLMEVAQRAYDIEALMLDPDSLSTESLEKAFEFDVLYGILDSEVSELENLVNFIETDIGNVEKEANREESEGRLKGRLHAATQSLKQMQDLIALIRREFASFDKAIDPSHHKVGTCEGGGGYENGHVSSHTTMQVEDQRNVLHMLEQSIARELDFENKLCDSGAVVEELKMKLHHVEQETYFLEESVEAISERTFAAENASELFLGISKELIDRINTMQSKLSASGCMAGDLKSKLEQSLVQLHALKGSSEVMQDNEKNAGQEATQSQRLSTPEFFTLQQQVQKLEDCLSAEATEKGQNTSVSEISTFGKIIVDIKDAISKAESRTQTAEARGAELTQTNIQLNEELNSLKSQGSDREGLLEQRLMESDAQLEHTRASFEASSEQVSMLRSLMSDMEHVIQDQKEKYLQAETRAESAESKCTLLTDTNLELNEESSFLRGRAESLEKSLRHANRLKLSTAKDIGIKTKTITDLVAKLALERERLHLQIVALTKKNRMLAQRCKENVNEGILLSKSIAANEGELTNVTEEVLLTSSLMQTQVKATAETLEESEAVIAAPLEDESEAVRSIQPTLLNWKYIFAAFFVLSAAALVHLLTQSVVPGFK
uniref:Uncharacterized protein n=1 Tax=Avena sativa TaxID=4498 RepID=A0ACD5VVH1_AVESA